MNTWTARIVERIGEEIDIEVYRDRHFVGSVLVAPRDDMAREVRGIIWDDLGERGELPESLKWGEPVTTEWREENLAFTWLPEAGNRNLAIYYNSDGTMEIVELDSADCVYLIIQQITENEILAVFSSETEYKAVGDEIAVGDGDRFQRLVLR